MDPKSNATPKGLNTMAEMPGFGDEHPRTFYGIQRIRNNVGSVFAMNERFGGVVRALKPHTQAVELLSMCICHYTSI